MWFCLVFVCLAPAFSAFVYVSAYLFWDFVSHPIFNVEWIYFMIAEECAEGRPKRVGAVWVSVLKRTCEFMGCLAEVGMYGAGWHIINWHFIDNF
jgi:hypothetical protein